MKNHLVTNFDYQLYDLNKNNIVLGEWCIPYSSKNKFKKYFIKIANPYGYTKLQADDDLGFVLIYLIKFQNLFLKF